MVLLPDSPNAEGYLQLIEKYSSWRQALESSVDCSHHDHAGGAASAAEPRSVLPVHLSTFAHSRPHSRQPPIMTPLLAPGIGSPRARLALERQLQLVRASSPRQGRVRLPSATLPPLPVLVSTPRKAPRRRDVSHRAGRATFCLAESWPTPPPRHHDSGWQQQRAPSPRRGRGDGPRLAEVTAGPRQMQRFVGRPPPDVKRVPIQAHIASMSPVEDHPGDFSPLDHPGESLPPRLASDVTMSAIALA